MDYIHIKPLSPGIEITQQISEETSALSDKDKPDQAAMDMFNRAVTLNASGDKAEALAEYARLVARFEGCNIPEVLEIVEEEKERL